MGNASSTTKVGANFGNGAATFSCLPTKDDKTVCSGPLKDAAQVYASCTGTGRENEYACQYGGEMQDCLLVEGINGQLNAKCKRRRGGVLSYVTSPAGTPASGIVTQIIGPSIVVSWTGGVPSTGYSLVGYIVNRADGTGSPAPLFKTPKTNLSYTDSSKLKSGTSYTYTVDTVYAVAPVPTTPTPNITVPYGATGTSVTFIPGPLLKVVAGKEENDLAWTAVSGATAYNIYRNNSSTALNTTHLDPTVTTYTDTGLTPGNAYSYQVAATIPDQVVLSNSASGTPTKSSTWIWIVIGIIIVLLLVLLAVGLFIGLRKP